MLLKGSGHADNNHWTNFTRHLHVYLHIYIGEMFSMTIHVQYSSYYLLFHRFYTIASLDSDGCLLIRLSVVCSPQDCYQSIHKSRYPSYHISRRYQQTSDLYKPYFYVELLQYYPPLHFIYPFVSVSKYDFSTSSLTNR